MAVSTNTRKAISSFYRGDTQSYKFDFGAGVDITNWKIILTFKESDDDPDQSAILQVSNTAGDNPLDDVANGVMYVTLHSTESMKLEPKTTIFFGFRRVVLGTSPSLVKTLMTGKVAIKQNICHSTA